MKRVLITPMDWGLGHATRCIPIVRELECLGCEVLIASSGDALALLKREFPRHRFFSLPGYAPRYPVKGSMVLSMARQIPHFMRVIRREHRAVESLVESESIDMVISDNRYGCWSRRVTSVFVTHQSNILMPLRFGLLSRFVRFISTRLINRFDRCWVPDFPDGHSLAGALIAFGKFGFRIPVDYIGWLSRFEVHGEVDPPTLDIAAVLSGPEPQRSAFESRLLPQLKSSGMKFRLVRGLPSAVETPSDDRISNFMDSIHLRELITSAAIVIARSGYSTVMDLHVLGKRVIFVPTPGQTEQEYIARRLQEREIAYSTSQGEFDLIKAIRESEQYDGFAPAGSNHLLREAIARLLA